MPQTQKQRVGQIGENAAADWYKAEGYEIIARNVHESHQEIDLIARNDQSLVFVEVKTRTQSAGTSSRYGRPADAVDASKRRFTVLAAQRYLREHPDLAVGIQPRIDIIEVYLRPDGSVERVRPFRNAFGAR